VIRAYTDANGNGVIDPGETTIAGSATTDGNGDYSISLNPGTYVVCEVLQATWTQSEPVNTKCAEIAELGDGGYAITVTSGSSDPGNDFGNFQGGTISGQKFKDADAGGDKDDGEPGLMGWEIHVFGTDGQGNAVHEHATTDANGDYSFSVAPGSYTVCETTTGQTGWVQSFPTSGEDCSSHSGASGLGYSVTVTSGETESGKDFGNTPLSRATITFEALADLPGGGDATHATEISCEDSFGASVGSVLNSNTLTTDNVKTNQSSLTCTITFVDP
jgi:SdrD B-like domain